MTMNSSGPISLAGTTAGQSIEIENGGNGTTQISLNDAAVRSLAGVASGQITMPTDFYGKSNRVTANITISANTTNYVLNTAKVTGYVAGKTDVTLTINSGIFVSSASTGSYAFQVDTSWTTGDTVKVINNGTIIGRGGNGGSGGQSTTGSPGSSAGPALYVQRATTFTNGSGRISGGGGGGGGGTGQTYKTAALSGGGGGGGIGVSSGGSSPGPNAGSGGGAGTLTSAGSGGAGFLPGSYNAGYGGNGGSYASSGSAGYNNGTTGTGAAGGAGGLAIQGYSNISWVSTGTINGGTSG